MGLVSCPSFPAGRLLQRVSHRSRAKQGWHRLQFSQGCSAPATPSHPLMITNRNQLPSFKGDLCRGVSRCGVALPMALLWCRVSGLGPLPVYVRGAVWWDFFAPCSEALHLISTTVPMTVV